MLNDKRTIIKRKLAKPIKQRIRSNYQREKNIIGISLHRIPFRYLVNFYLYSPSRKKKKKKMKNLREKGGGTREIYIYVYKRDVDWIEQR